MSIQKEVNHEEKSFVNEESRDFNLEFIGRKEEHETGNLVKEEDKKVLKKSIFKRKRDQENQSLGFLHQYFLQIMYPLSACMSKRIAAGFHQNFNYSPIVSLINGSKQIMLNELSWNSFNKYLQLIECYVLNKVYGRKTCVNLIESDIEIDIIKMRGTQFVRFKDASKHDEKICLSSEEFQVLVGVVPAVNRYMKQMKLSEPMVKDYLEDTIEKQKDVPLIYSPIDSSIYNRLPQEVFLHRKIKSVLENNDQDSIFKPTFIVQDDSA